MEFTAAAQWLNNSFAGFDNAILEFMHKLELSAGTILTPIAKFITLIGEKGLLMFALAFLFLCFSRTRKLGLCMFGAVCCGALITNIILKDLIARPRPFEAMAPFMKYWNAVGSPAEDGFSFPSGHVTAAAAGCAALCFVKGKKLILPSAIYVFLMCFSRNYLMAHYPSDVLAAALVGLLSGFIAYLIASFIFTYMEDNDDLPLFGMLLNFNLPLPDPSGLVKLVNRVPSRPTAGKRANTERRSRSTGVEAREELPVVPPEEDDLPNFDLDAFDADALLDEEANQLRREASASRRSHSPKKEKQSVSSLFGTALSAVNKKTSALKKKSAAPTHRGSHADSRGKSAKGAVKATPAHEAVTGNVGTSLDFDFDRPAQPSPSKSTADWNTRWEEYRQRRDKAQVKTAPEPATHSQREFERIFSPGDEDMKLVSEKKSPAVSREELENTLNFLSNSGILDIPEEVKAVKKQESEATPAPVPQTERLPAEKAAAPSDSLPSFSLPSRISGSDKLDLDEIYALIGEERPSERSSSVSHR